MFSRLLPAVVCTARSIVLLGLPVFLQITLVCIAAPTRLAEVAEGACMHACMHVPTVVPSPVS